MRINFRRFSFMVGSTIALVASGCATVSDLTYELTQKVRTQKAWEHYDTGSACYTMAYRNGWKAGHYDVLTGGDGCPPIFAPECYSNPLKVIFHCDEPRHEWYVGFQDGAACAHQSPDTHYLKPWLPPPPQIPTCLSCPPEAMVPQETIPFELNGPYEPTIPEEPAAPVELNASPEDATPPAPPEEATPPAPAPAPAPAPEPKPGSSANPEPAPAPPEPSAPKETAPATPKPVEEPKPAAGGVIPPEAESALRQFDRNRFARLLVQRKSLPVQRIEPAVVPVPPADHQDQKVETIGFQRDRTQPQQSRPASAVPRRLEGLESNHEFVSLAFQSHS